ncbi:MAG: glycosyltransferase [Patescibacteria group bacterium]|jgi:glycosyltransferase involved in cell wall biosynthesis
MKRKIKVAVVSPAFGDWGGPEVVVQNLVSELAKKDDVDVTLFCPEDWKIGVKRIATLKQSLWNMKDFKKQKRIIRQNYITYSQMKVLNYQDKFDIIHLNSQRHAYPVGKISKIPCVLTLHSGIDKDEFELINEAKIFTVSLTDFHDKKLDSYAIIGNGVPVKKVEYSVKKGEYFMTVARLTPQKGVDKAIKIALKAKIKLLIFGRINHAYKDYFEKEIKPFIDGKNIIYKKEVSHKKIYDYYRKAKALLFTIQEPEPFGLVLSEALICGTPIIGTKIGQMPELLGGSPKVAYLSNEMDDLVKAVKEVDEIFDRQECRNYAEKYFSSSHMADEYIKVYQRILALKKK